MRILFSILFLVPLLSFSQVRDYKNFDKAVRYNVEGNIKKAIKYANKALEKYPDWRKPNLLLASIYANSNQIELAADYLLKVYDENNINDIKGVEQLVDLYYSNGFYNEALYYAEKILAYDTTDSKINSTITNSRFAIKAIENPVDFTHFSLEGKVNSSFAEFVNTVSVDGEKLFFTRRIEYNDRSPQEDLFFFSLIDSTLTPLSFNTNFNEGAITVSPDGMMCVYTACDRQNSLGGCDLFIRRYISEYGWSQEYNLGVNVNSNQWETQASFSPDGRYLYFISNRGGGVGQDDIWRSEITSEGFMQAENIGKPVNTKYNEMSPFLHPDNLTLYFSSDGHIGMGDYDIYVARRESSSEGWQLPKNIGYPINTYNAENSLVVDNDGKTAYFSSNKNNGLEDIFVFDLPEPMQANAVSELELEIIKQSMGVEIVLKDVTFPSNSYEIDSSSYAQLDQLIAYLKKQPDIEIEIQGHTDDIGSEYDNLILSQERARVVYDYLIKSLQNKLSYKGYGESRPLISNNSDVSRELNRRTSFVIH